MYIWRQRKGFLLESWSSFVYIPVSIMNIVDFDAQGESTHQQKSKAQFFHHKDTII